MTQTLNSKDLQKAELAKQLELAGQRLREARQQAAEAEEAVAEAEESYDRLDTYGDAWNVMERLEIHHQGLDGMGVEWEDVAEDVFEGMEMIIRLARMAGLLHEGESF